MCSELVYLRLAAAQIQSHSRMAGVEGQQEAMDLSSTAQSSNVVAFVPWTQGFNLLTGSQPVFATDLQPSSNSRSQPCSIGSSMKSHSIQAIQVKKEPVTSPVEVDMLDKKQKISNETSSKSSKKGGSKSSKQVCINQWAELIFLKSE